MLHSTCPGAALFLACLSLGCLPLGLLHAEEPPLYAHRGQDAPAFSWADEIVKKVPPLRHERGDRLPMILWQPGAADSEPVGFYKELLARGLTQHIHIDEKMIPLGKALQDAGSPVIMMEGVGGQWPASLAGDPKNWAHRLDPGFAPEGPLRACPAIATGWAMNGDAVRAALRKFRDAGVRVDAVWMDYEGDPAGAGADAYQQALHCARCRETLPPSALASEKGFNDYCMRRYFELAGGYLAAPVAEVFPGCSTTNWRAAISTTERPQRSWPDRVLPPSLPPFFTATNPVAYGNTLFFHGWSPRFRLDREHVDEFYTRTLLNNVSNDAANRRVWAPGRRSVPWVCRWCPDDDDPKIPIMTRARYREVLRHLWLRGVAAMQVFNPVNKGFEEMAVAEVQDAVSVYDEMLEYRDFLDKGTPLCLDVPKAQDSGVLWSGLALGDRAVVRTFKPGGTAGGGAEVTIEPWPGRKVTLRADATGRTYLLVLKDGKVEGAR